jgi:hypothetical protein
MPFPLELHRSALPPWARAADIAAIALLFLALFVLMDGGALTTLAGVRISVRSFWRPVMWALALIALRHLFVRSPRIDQSMIADIGHAARAAGPLVEDTRRRAADRGVTAPAVSREPQLVRRLVAGALVLALFVFLTALMTYPQVYHLSRGLSIDYGDPLFSTWRLAWIAHQLRTDPAHLFDGNIFYPETSTLAYSDAMIVPSLMAAPLIWLGIPQLMTYNLVFLSAFVLSGAAMFLLVRSLTDHTGAALIAGFVFAYLPFRFMHYAHLELQMAFWMPLCLWALHRTVREGRVRDGLLAGLFLGLQALSSWYYGIFLATYVAVVGAVLLLGERHRRTWPVARALAAGALLAAVLIVPTSRPYFAARASVGERPVSEIAFYSATPINYFAAHPRNATFGPFTSNWGAQERELFQGAVVPALALAALWPPLSAARIAYLAGLLLALELSFGLNGVIYPWLHAYVTPFRGLRVPARMAILVGVSLAILCGFTIARLCRLANRRVTAGAVLAVTAALVFVEYRTSLVLAEVWTRPPKVYDLLPNNRNTVVLNLPLIRPDIALEPVYMYFSTFRWHTLVNGYSGFSPPSYQAFVDSMANFPDSTSMQELRRRGVEYVIVHGAFVEPRDYAALMARLDACQELVKIGAEQWEERETRLYRVETRGLVP